LLTAGAGNHPREASGEQTSGTKAALSRAVPCCQLWSPEAVGGEGSSGTDHCISGTWPKNSSASRSSDDDR
jgi:hypothetical protein